MLRTVPKRVDRVAVEENHNAVNEFLERRKRTGSHRVHLVACRGLFHVCRFDVWRQRCHPPDLGYDPKQPGLGEKGSGNTITTAPFRSSASGLRWRHVRVARPLRINRAPVCSEDARILPGARIVIARTFTSDILGLRARPFTALVPPRRTTSKAHQRSAEPEERQVRRSCPAARSLLKAGIHCRGRSGLDRWRRA